MRDRETVYTACSNCSEVKDESEMYETENEFFCDEECMEDFQEGTI